MNISSIKYILSFFILSAFGSVAVVAQNKMDSTTGGIADPKKYTQLFKNKTVVTKKGLFTLHQMQGKVYFEYPLALLNQYMLVASVAERVSHAREVSAGEQAHDPLCFSFSLKDSTVMMNLHQFEQQSKTSRHIDPVLASFPVLAYGDNGKSVVFDATSFFVNGRTDMDPFQPVGGLATRRTNFKSDLSKLAEIEAFDNNVSVTSIMTYGVSSTFFGFTVAEDKPTTIWMKRSIRLLPSKMMRPMRNDPRIGVFYTTYMDFDPAGAASKQVFFANRWHLQPKDSAAYLAGKLSEPVQPIRFYIDTSFPQHWQPYIKEGIEVWNKAFERAGFKNAVVAQFYPANDPGFDANNLQFNCIKYAPSETQNAMGPSWVDPRTGEILNASVYVYHGMMDVLQDWLFVQTAAADARARKAKLSMELLGPALKYVITHEIGHCLGLMHNMGASSTFPVDSLRSASFTQQYGTTPSIMDYARFNYVAQPGDFEKGVKLSPPELGIYDYYAIQWLYRWYPASMKATELEMKQRDFISQHIKDPRYRYSKQQFSGNVDPSALSEDLGDDHVKATRYAMANLKYLMTNLNEWVKRDDPDFDFRKTMNFNIINIQYYWYWTHLLHNLGGVYLYERFEGDQLPAYRAVPKEVQKESLLAALSVLKNNDWLTNSELELHMNAMNGDAGAYLRNVLFPYLFNWVSNIGFGSTKEAQQPYSVQEALNDIFQFVWYDAGEGARAQEANLDFQRNFVAVITRNAGIWPKKTNRPNNATAAQEEWAKLHANALHSGLMPLGCLHHDHRSGLSNATTAVGYSDGAVQSSVKEIESTAGFGFAPRILYQNPDISDLYLDLLKRSQSVLQKKRKSGSEKEKAEYDYLLVQVNRALKLMAQ